MRKVAENHEVNIKSKIIVASVMLKYSNFVRLIFEIKN